MDGAGIGRVGHARGRDTGTYLSRTRQAALAATDNHGAPRGSEARMLPERAPRPCAHPHTSRIFRRSTSARTYGSPPSSSRRSHSAPRRNRRPGGTNGGRRPACERPEGTATTMQGRAEHVEIVRGPRRTSIAGRALLKIRDVLQRATFSAQRYTESTHITPTSRFAGIG